MDFEFDLSEEQAADITIVIQGQRSEKTVKQVNKISDLTLDQKIQINNVLWYTNLKDEALKNYLMEEFGIKDIIAENLTYRHHQSYKKDPGFFTIFEKNSIESMNLKSIAMAERHQIRKKANSRKPLFIYYR